MARVWKCTCGASFPKYGFAFTTHIKEGREKGEEHGSAGLVDAETGEILARTLPEAVQMGLVPPSTKGQRRASPKGPRSASTPSGDGSEGPSPEGSEGASADGPEALPSEDAKRKRSAASVRGKFYTQEVMLDGRLLLLYDLARQRFPEWQGTVGEWIWDCILQFYVEHSDQLGLGELFQDSLEVERV